MFILFITEKQYDYQRKCLLTKKMFVDKENVILFIEPNNCKSKEVNDVYTRFMSSLIKEAEIKYKTGIVFENGEFVKNLACNGVHECVCGEESEDHDYKISKGCYTNSLADHYLRDHRSEVPVSELNKIDKLMELNK